MSSLQPFSIAGYNAGLQSDRKPFLLPDKAFPTLRNAWCFRERIIKRECLQLVGRLTRVVPLGNFFDNSFPTWTTGVLEVSGYIANIDTGNPATVTTKGTHNLVNGNTIIISNVIGSVGYNGTFTVTIVTPYTFTINLNATGFTYTSGGTFFSNQPLTSTEPNAEIVPGTFSLTLSGGRVFVDNGNGTLTFNGSNFGIINYQTGVISITTDLGASAPTTLSYKYYPGLPVMGIRSRELSTVNFEQTVFFDTRYTYVFDGTNFSDVPGVTWSNTSNASQFFWTTNFQGADSSIRTFFVTNDFDDPGSPMRYTQDGATYTNFNPQTTAGGPLILQALILIPYYGRLIALNTIEGTALGNVGNKNYFARARFSREGNPLATDAWQTDIFGAGGFADAPTAEQIVSATLYKNTLIVRFERSTWQLRFVGNYGQPFLWERISSDFGSECTFSSVLFDSGDLTIGQRAITVSDATTVKRIDEAIPDIVFSILNKFSGPERVQGIRDFRREVVFWCYNDATQSQSTQYFPNTVLVYNYRNQTFAQFDDNVTVFGNLQPIVGVSWDSTNIFWDDEDITWDDVNDIAEFTKIAIGNAAGYIHFYGYKTPDDQQNFIQAINLTVNPITITVPNHNIFFEETIYITGLQFLTNNMTSGTPLTTSLNNTIYLARYVDDNTLSLFLYDPVGNEYYTNFPFTPVSSAYYVGGGEIAIFPQLNVVTKDFNPYTQKGRQMMVSYVDFLMEVTNQSAMTVGLFSNTYQAYAGNIIIGQVELETTQPEPYYGNDTMSGSDILWHRLYYNLTGQLIRIQMTYDASLMNLLNTHQETWSLNAMTIHAKPSGKILF